MNEQETSSEVRSYSKGRKLTIEIAGAAVFIALSAIISAATTSILPRVPGWGIAFIDPVSIIWLTCFLIFGWRSGLLCTVVGSIILNFFDPTPIIGPIFKFLATVPFVIVPTISYFIKKKKESSEKLQDWLKDPKRYTAVSLLGLGLRLVLTLIFNALLFSTLWSHILPWVSLGFIGLPDVTAWNALIIGVILINSEQTIWDTVIPYLITFKLETQKLLP
ncbi:MAG: ECF transporter S component [Candidatus Hodarchaeota archaeon]